MGTRIVTSSGSSADATPGNPVRFSHFLITDNGSVGTIIDSRMMNKSFSIKGGRRSLKDFGKPKWELERDSIEGE